ncbi:winged helix-turn-helix transcriptional regulator [Sulfurospirillum arcachonense]|uniref:winged helix-turn-helix transcriptional regulator n=1 Tax=Sulfurospirillum arcachonense TaxID=57666 RepID=UPI000469392F|nr:helix-turn-helix domain-containing protein [Sulfurospirillum arcachonense]
MPSLRKNKVHCEDYKSEIEITLELISGKWVVLLIMLLWEEKIVRFNEFRKNFPDITQKMLSQQLKKLETYKIVEKEVYPEVPPKVEYRLTQQGEKLIPILEQMQIWGATYLKNR